MAIHLNDQAFRTAAAEMAQLQKRNRRLREKLENMYKNLTTALNTPAGHEMEFAVRDVLLEPIDNRSKVIQHMSNTLDTIIGNVNGSGVYYDKLFDEYDELDRILKNKTTR